MHTECGPHCSSVYTYSFFRVGFTIENTRRRRPCTLLKHINVLYTIYELIFFVYP